MKAEDWKFDKYLPDSEDIEAGLIASEAYFGMEPIKGLNDAERELSAFHAGFNRGTAWAIAKVSDNEEIFKQYFRADRIRLLTRCGDIEQERDDALGEIFLLERQQQRDKVTIEELEKNYCTICGRILDGYMKEDKQDEPEKSKE